MFKDFESWALLVPPVLLLVLFLDGLWPWVLSWASIEDYLTLRTIYYFIPVIPFITRGLIARKYVDIMSRRLTKDQRSNPNYQSFLIAMTGYSFAGIVAITVLKEDDLLTKLQLPMFYLFISFLSYFAALSLEGYKFYISRDLLSDMLTDIGSLSLVCFVVSFVLISKYGRAYKIATFIIAFIVWSADYIIQLRYTTKAYEGIRQGG